jgi:DNA-binding response OmpR family regulator
MHLALIPVIVVSARDVQGNKARALSFGAKAFVQKPWNDDELLALITQHLGPPDVPLSEVASSPYGGGIGKIDFPVLPAE